MKNALQKLILQGCPIIYRGRHDGLQSNLMCFGFECGDGWFQIIYDLSIAIEDKAMSLKNNGVADELLPCVSQVKEKYGGLRFYVHNIYDDMEDLIDAAEAKSERTCSICGKPGKTRDIKRWLNTLCYLCFKTETP